MPSAFSTVRTETSAWTVVQTPQKRWVNIHASLGSRPLRIVSMPRHICPDDQALVTFPLSTWQSIRRCPSILVTGSTVILFAIRTSLEFIYNLIPEQFQANLLAHYLPLPTLQGLHQCCPSGNTLRYFTDNLKAKIAKDTIASVRMNSITEGK